MTGKIDKGRSFLNATDETANPYGLILSEQERKFIYSGLNRLDYITDALLYGRTGWKQEAQATLTTAGEFVGIVIAAAVLHRFSVISMKSALVIGVIFLILQRLNLLLTHEKIADTFARRQRGEEKEAKERARYFKDMGTKDMSLEE
jgi:hypothetical protein